MIERVQRKKKTGRPPIVTGGSHITVSQQRRSGSTHQLTIGKQLWYGIGAPKYVRIKRARSQLLVYPRKAPGAYNSGRYSIVGGHNATAPRFTVGKQVFNELRLVPGMYPDCYIDGKHIVVVLES